MHKDKPDWFLILGLIVLLLVVSLVTFFVAETGFFARTP